MKLTKEEKKLADKLHKERDAALLSMDYITILNFMVRCKVKIPSSLEVFWAAVHKARTGCNSLPIEERRKSKKWLLDRGLRSYDDGDI